MGQNISKEKEYITIQKEIFNQFLLDLETFNSVLGQTKIQMEECCKTLQDTIHVKRQKIILLEKVINEIIDHKSKNKILRTP